MEENLVNIGIWAAIIMVGIAIAASVLMPLINALSNPSALVKMGGGILIIGVLFLIAWGTAGNEVTELYRSYNVNSESTSQLVGGGLRLTYILFILAVVGIVFSNINRVIKS